MGNDFKCPREGDLDELKADIKDIKTNHLAAINKQISTIKQKLARHEGMMYLMIGLILVILARLFEVI